MTGLDASPILKPDAHSGAMGARVIAGVAAALLAAACTAVGAPLGPSASPPVRSSFASAIYPPPASSPDWGLASGCPSLVGVQRPGPDATNAALRIIRRLDFRHADRALWPVLTAQGMSPTETAPHPASRLTRRGVVAGPASDSAYADLIRRNCGGRTLRASWWAAVCPAGHTGGSATTGPCKLSTAPALTEHYMLIERRGSWLVWFLYP
jgi:hypothetical protein